MSSSLGADTGPGARCWPPNHHNLLWRFLLQERQSATTFVWAGLSPTMGSCNMVRGDHVWGDSASCWRGILLGQGYSYRCYSETQSPCPDTWGGVNQSPPGCTCYIMLGSRTAALVQAPCHCKPPLWEGCNWDFWGASEFYEPSICFHPVEHLPAWKNLGNMRTVNYSKLQKFRRCCQYLN